MNEPTADGHVTDLLVPLFAECRELDIGIPDDMPLDTAEHRAAAVRYLRHLIFVKRRGGNTWTGHG